MAGIYQTPPNQHSFSSLIDDAILATGKPGSLIAAIQHANLCVRECQGLGLFARDLIEDTIDVTGVPFTWNRPPFFRSIRTVKYNRYIDGSGNHRERVDPDFLLPGKQQRGKRDYYYAANNYYVFSGVSSSDTIDIAAYFWAAPLSYYGLFGQDTTLYPGGPYPIRPAYFDITLMQWMYLLADESGYVTSLGDPTLEEQYRTLSNNWLCADWRNLILSGTKAKLWNSTGDPRGNVEYSLYKQNQTLLRNTTGREAEGF